MPSIIKILIKTEGQVIAEKITGWADMELRHPVEELLRLFIGRQAIPGGLGGFAGDEQMHSQPSAQRILEVRYGGPQ